MTSPSLDWSSIQQRIKIDETSLHRRLHPDDDSIRAAYRERAVRLAAGRTFEAKPSLSTEPALIFRLRGRPYAVETRFVGEVSRLGSCTRVPGLPAAVMGVTCHQGHVCTVMDLAEMLGVGGEPTRADGTIVALTRERRRLLVCVDTVDEVRDMDLASVTAPEMEERVSHCVRGVHAGGIVVISVDGLFRHPAVTSE